MDFLEPQQAALDLARCAGGGQPKDLDLFGRGAGSGPGWAGGPRSADYPTGIPVVGGPPRSDPKSVYNHRYLP